MRTQTCNLPWQGFGTWLCGLQLVVISCIALCAQSCKPRALEQSTQGLAQSLEQKAESITHEIRILRTQTIPRDTLLTTISLMSLRELPKGAVYSERQGRAEVKISRKDSLVYIYASCDSLAQIINYYERLVQGINTQSQTQKQSLRTRIEHPRAPPWTAFLMGLCLGAFGGLWIRKEPR